MPTSDRNKSAHPFLLQNHYRGEALSFTQEDLNITGHALELRVYAEDPLDDFFSNFLGFFGIGNGFIYTGN
ncbi:MAG TPA: hypothetical protein EYN16_06225, partial [Flavobacteriaceae bacterium]|nr:hypothetical protein [Flavobacteriaceae bacterium]